MPIPKKVEEYLKNANKKFEVIGHKTVYTAYDLAQTLGEKLENIAKAILVKADNAYKIVVVPSGSRLNLPKLKKLLKAKSLSIPKEKVMAKIFKVKPGALSAFGKFHKTETLIDKSLLKAKSAIFQAGSFTDSVKMKVKDFAAIEGARVANFAKKATYTVVRPVVKKVKKIVQRKKIK